jgi:hypothetical protein
MTDQERINNLTAAAEEERRVEENGPCIACGAYNKTHEEGCSMLEDKCFPYDIFMM